METIGKINKKIKYKEALKNGKMRKGIISKSAEFIKNKEVSLVGESQNQLILNVGDQIVTFKKRPGRVEDACTCENHTKFCKENPRCSHKLAAATFLVMRKIKW